MKKDKINEDVKKPETADTTLTETTGGIGINFWDDDNNNRDPSGQTMDPFDYGKNFPGGERGHLAEKGLTVPRRQLPDLYQKTVFPSQSEPVPL